MYRRSCNLFWPRNRAFCSSTVPPIVNNAKESNELSVSYEDISRAYYRIKSGVNRTHCDYSDFLSELCDTKLFMKKDFMQYTGSFKERGGRNALLQLSAEQRKVGVVAASAGNHALALAWHGKQLGIPITCVMPVNAPFTKIAKCRKFGANIILHGEHIGEAKTHAMKTFPDLRYINGYDDKEIIAGAGTAIATTYLSID